MSCNDIYMLLYAREVRRINKRFADLYKNTTTNKVGLSQDAQSGFE